MQSSGEYAIRIESSECDAVTSSDTSEGGSKDDIRQCLVSQDSVTLTGRELELLVNKMSLEESSALDRYIARLKEKARLDAFGDVRKSSLVLARMYCIYWQKSGNFRDFRWF